MHSASFDAEVTTGKDGGEVLVAIASLVTEGRIPGKLNAKCRGFHEGPHCVFNKSAKDHKCDSTDVLCSTFEITRNQVLELWKKNIPVCIEVLLTCSCTKDDSLSFVESLLLEKWSFSVNHRRSAEPLHFNFVQLMNAIRSQLYFSQLTAWLTPPETVNCRTFSNRNLKYRLSIPGETYETTTSNLSPAAGVKHDFPVADIGNGYTVSVSCYSSPRMSEMPILKCHDCAPPKSSYELEHFLEAEALFDDRMHTVCTQKGKHRCDDYEEIENCNKICHTKLRNQRNTSTEPSTSRSILSVDMHKTRLPSQDISFSRIFFNCHNHDLRMIEDKGKLLLDAIERSGSKSTNCEGSMKEGDRRSCDEDYVQTRKNESSDNSICDMSESDISSIKDKSKIFKYCDSPIPKFQNTINEKNTILHRRNAKKKLTFGDEKISVPDIHKSEHNIDIPSAKEQAKFRKDLDNAASMVFHSRTGLPLTSSPAPIRRGRTCFDFDSSINSVSAIKSALFSTTFSTDDDSESDGSIVSPCSPEINNIPKMELSSVKYRRKGHAANLLGSFEESVLNGRLEPVSTVHGFTAELGASGSFVPKHMVVPVTVFFYTLGDNDKVSSPYLSHINLGKKGYNVPRTGTVQVTLFNPLGTVVKMFVIMYDLSDMPNNSQTFIRQRTLYMPTNCKDKNVEWGPKWLRYLVHLRFLSSKSGKIYLHSDIRMIIFRKSDMDTATAHGIDMSYELRSFTHMPMNPRFSPISPRK